MSKPFAYYRLNFSIFLSVLASILAITILARWPLPKANAEVGAVWVVTCVAAVLMSPRKLTALAACTGIVAIRALIGAVLVHSFGAVLVGIVCGATALELILLDAKNSDDLKLAEALSSRSPLDFLLNLLLLAAVIVIVLCLQQFLLKVVGTANLG